jgi:selenocysteine lyase/cysteine desulfurase
LIDPNAYALDRAPFLQFTAINMTVHPLFDPCDFRIPEGVSHVCAAGETAFLRRHDEAYGRYVRDKSAGARGRTAQEEVVERSRRQLAALWGMDAGDIGWVGSVAEGVSLVLESIDWRPGDNICAMSTEYPSLVAPFLARQQAPYQVKFADPATAEDVAALVDERSRVILVSYVSYLNGERFDLGILRRAADAVGALLVVDYTQASGYLPISADVADFAFSASYKWMLGMTGVATACWNRRRQPDWAPSTAGWYSLANDNTRFDAGITLRGDALRFTRGNPAHASLYVLSSALDYLSQFDTQAIQAHVQRLTADLLARLAGLGIHSSTPADPARHGASVCVARADAKALHGFLDREQVLAWNGRGRLRISFHGYNGTADVDRVEAALAKALAEVAA